MRPSFHPRLVNGPFDDPGLFIPLTFRKQALLFDLGDLNALPAGDILKISHIFVTHTHMDHFVGFDRVLRLLLGRSKTLHLFGPQGFMDNAAAKLSAYTWNLVQNYVEALTLRITEIRPDHRITQAFHCRQGFLPSERQIEQNDGSAVYREPALTVRSAVLDHQIPCLGLCVQERFHVNILKSHLEKLDLAVGPWLNHFKALLFQGADPALEIQVPTDKGPRTFCLGALANQIALITPGQKIGYVVDVAYSTANEEKIIALARDADHLFIEAAFLDKDRHIAQAKYHLTARQAGLIARKAAVRQMTVFHHSPRYTDQAHLLTQEARQAFEGR